MILRDLVFIAAVFGAGGSIAFYVRLRTRHPAVWRSLGSPSYFGLPIGKRMEAYRAFIFSRAVSELHDPWLAGLSKVMAVGGTVAFVLFVVGVILRWRY